MATASLDVPIQDEVVQEGPAAVQGIVDDVLLPVAGAWPIPRRMRAAWVAHDRGLALTPGMPARPAVGPRIDQVADAVVAADLLARQGDDSSGTSRQSA